MGFEDAYTLGYHFSMIEDKSQIHRFLTAYDEIRLSRASWAHSQDEYHQMFLSSPPGECQDMRDAQLGRSLEEGLGDDELAEMFKDDIELYAHDPAVETAAWWNQYGPMMLNSVPHRKSIVQIQVAENIVAH